VLLKQNSAASNKSYFSIAPETFNKIVKMKENINRNRTNFDGYKLSYLMISNYWFLGFVEGDGSFFLCNNRAIFSITQKDRQVLEAISLYIKTIKRDPIFKGLFVALQPNCIISGKNNNTAYQLIISDTDVLFQYIFPFFKDLSFLSRKGVDFKI
jgi:LAGLIDADG endonuclease